MRLVSPPRQPTADPHRGPCLMWRWMMMMVWWRWPSQTHANDPKGGRGGRKLLTDKTLITCEHTASCKSRMCNVEGLLDLYWGLDTSRTEGTRGVAAKFPGDVCSRVDWLYLGEFWSYSDGTPLKSLLMMRGVNWTWFLVIWIINAPMTAHKLPEMP